MKQTVIAPVIASIAGLLLCAGCGSNAPSASASSEHRQELERLRAANQEVKKLGAENQELGRLRRDNDELQRLRGFDAEIARLRSENEQMRKELLARNIPIQPPPPEPQVTHRIEPIQDLVRAFEDAAIVVTSQGAARPEDTPQEGDNILIDQSVIGLLIPEFQDRTNAGPYEVSGWLASKGVVFKNYQQLNYVGLTNYQIRRAPPKSQESPAK
jgi:outer membrane murein-binding lipoprotein Lpp